MLRVPGLPAGRARILLLLLLPFVFTLVFFFSRYGTLDKLLPPRPGIGPAPSPKGKPSDWWIEFFSRFEKTRPKLPLPELKHNAYGHNWRADFDLPREEMLELSDREFNELRSLHDEFISQLPTFARHLPYKPHTTGIVTSAGSKNFGQVISVILTTRRTGSKLPIEVILDSSDDWIDNLCAGHLKQYDVTCVYLDKVWAGLDQVFNFSPKSKFEWFQWKFIAMIASSYQNVLYFDADVLPIFNPDPILAPGAEPYASTGLITWPDFWVSTSSPLFYKIAGDIDVPLLTTRATSESGIMVFDKRRHADTILLAAYYNYNGFSHYYPMLSQRGPGEGDKETFLHAAIVLEGLRKKGTYQEPTEWMVPGAGVKKGYYDVKKMPVSHGRTNRGQWRGAVMQQMDPMEDYKAVMKAIQESKAKQHQTKKDSFVDRRRPFDTTPFHADTSYLEKTGNLTLKWNDSHYMFFHSNGIKPDFAKILDSQSALASTDEEEKFIRFWGDPGWIIERTGRDVEKLLWLDSQQLYCIRTTLTNVCEKITQVVDQLFKD
ncbi:mannosyltransferase putative-domain-containing protein [Cladorrhinum sp. PSN259]|nr:mannosyltransferase putative-domain-containing protein [Cladorrhinum sp. PSN259]